MSTFAWVFAFAMLLVAMTLNFWQYIQQLKLHDEYMRLCDRYEQLLNKLSKDQQ